MSRNLKISFWFGLLSCAANYFAWARSNALRDEIPSQNNYILLFYITACLLSLSWGFAAFLFFEERFREKIWAKPVGVFAAIGSVVCLMLLATAWPWFLTKY
jgi:hypothetical protein